MTEAQVASTPEALVGFLGKLEHEIAAIGLEAGLLSHWLHKGLTDAGFEAVLMETRRVKAALKAMPIKTDRRDAEGIARLLQMGWFRPVHCKAVSSQEMRALLTSRRSVKDALINMELSLRGVLRNFGLKLGQVSKGRYEAPRSGAGRRQRDAGSRRRADPARAGGSAPRAGRVGEVSPQSGKAGPGVPPADDHARRGPRHRADIHVGDRRSRAVPKIEGCWSLGWADAGTRPIRRARYCRRHHEMRRRGSARGALSGRHSDAEPRGDRTG